MNVGADEIFISDGAKCDTANILDILGHQNRIAIPTRFILCIWILT